MRTRSIGALLMKHMIVRKPAAQRRVARPAAGLRLPMPPLKRFRSFQSRVLLSPTELTSSVFVSSDTLSRSAYRMLLLL